MKERYLNGTVAPEALEARRLIAHELKIARKQLNLTQQALADRAGTQKSNISRMESGKYNPSLDFLVKLADCMGKKVDIHIE